MVAERPSLLVDKREHTAIRTLCNYYHANVFVRSENSDLLQFMLPKYVALSNPIFHRVRMDGI